MQVAKTSKQAGDVTKRRGARFMQVAKMSKQAADATLQPNNVPDRFCSVTDQ
jgi:hypothetical protein